MSATRTPPQPVTVPVRYAESWQDGFGARGWKLDLPGQGADVIAATPYCGDRIPTSVFIHDIVDHHLCGFQLSGYLDEAGALIQLALRTGSDPVPDYQQMVDEDLLTGLCQHDDWVELLPPAFETSVREYAHPADGLALLQQQFGEGTLRALLTAGFVHAGWQRSEQARRHWEQLGLQYSDRRDTALALQQLFEWMDTTVREHGWATASGRFLIARDHAEFEFAQPTAGINRSTAIRPN